MKTTILPLAVAISIALSGCAMSGPHTYAPQEDDNVGQITLGVPVFYWYSGSTVRLSHDWLITAAHNKKMLKDAHYHPTCDLALVKSPGRGGVAIGYTRAGATVYHVGYPIYRTLAKNPGAVLGEIDGLTISGQDFTDCTFVADTAVVDAGMSGGAVYNASGELVGITSGVATGTVRWPDGREASRPAVFVPLAAPSVKTWITRYTGITY